MANKQEVLNTLLDRVGEYVRWACKSDTDKEKVKIIIREEFAKLE